MKKEESVRRIRKARRAVRTRKKILGTGVARLTVFRSNKHIYAQIIDDKKGVTMVTATEKDLGDAKLNKTQKAEEIGKAIAAKAKEKKIKTVVFDKGPYRYHGRIKALADAARKEGLVF